MARTRFNRDDSALGAHPGTDADRLMRNIRRSGRLLESSRKRKATEEASRAESSRDEKKEKSNGNSDFDCNICFEVAQEPVVTCCGHLFCWPCLYQWLYVHCNHKECPLCKGKVDESSVVPIYGRGSSEDSGEKKREDGQQGLKIPPRPKGNRVDSPRQQYRNPIRRSETWILEVQELFNELPERFQIFQRGDRTPQPFLGLLRTHLPRTGNTQPGNSQPGNPQPGNSQPGNPQPVPVVTTNFLRQQILQSSGPLATTVENQSSARRREQPVVITVSDDSRDPVPSLSQNSSSSTMGMIQGERAVPNGPLEPNRARTSMVLRSRTRSNRTSNSLPAPHLLPRR